MSGHRLRYELLLFAVLGFEAVWLALASWVLGGEAAAGAMPWLLYLVGGALLLYNRLLLIFGLWSGRLGPLLSLAGGFLAIWLLMHLVAGGGSWERMLGELRTIEEAPAPLIVITLIGGALWYRAALTARILPQMVTFRTIATRFGWAALLFVGFLLLATGRGILIPGALAFLFVGFGLVAFALARAGEVSAPHQGSPLPFTPRWVATLLAALGSTLLLAALLTRLLSFSGLAILAELFAPVRYLFSLLLAALTGALGLLLLPVIRWLFARGQSPEMAPPPQPVSPPEETEVIMDAVAAVEIPPLLVLLLALLALFLLYRLTRHLLFQHVQSDELPQESRAEYEKIEALPTGEGGWKRWWSRGRAREGPRPRFGVEDVRDLYRNLLLLGDARGVPRPAEATPYGYLSNLSTHYPSCRQDFSALTDAYVSARYGERRFSRAEMEQLQQAWYRILDEVGEG